MTQQPDSIAYLSLGSNLEPRLKLLDECCEHLARLAGTVLELVSGVYESAAEEMKADTPAFLNQVVRLRTVLAPEALLKRTEKLERTLGRTQKGRMQSRTIDIDILLLGEQVINTPRLTVPHPRLHLRAFVLVPLLELDNTLKNPNTGQPFRRLLTAEMADKVTRIHENVGAPA